MSDRHYARLRIITVWSVGTHEGYRQQMCELMAELQVHFSEMMMMMTIMMEMMMINGNITLLCTRHIEYHSEVLRNASLTYFDDMQAIQSARTQIQI